MDSKHLVSYSSEEEEAGHPAHPRQKDTNYDDVGMDMSSGEEDEQRKEREHEKLFANREEYLAFKNQFHGQGGPKDRNHSADVETKARSTSEYGSTGTEVPVKKSKWDEDGLAQENSTEDQGVDERTKLSAAVDERDKERFAPPRHEAGGVKDQESSRHRRHKDKHEQEGSASNRDQRDRRGDRDRHGRRRDERKRDEGSSRKDRAASRRDGERHHHDRHRDKRERPGNRDDNKHRDDEDRRGGHKRDDRRPRSENDRSQSSDHHHSGPRSGSHSASASTSHHNRQFPGSGAPTSRFNASNKQMLRERKLVALGLTTPEELAKVQEAAQSHQTESHIAKVEEMTGVELPKYYNPSAVNPLKLAEQMKKRQMLWGKKPTANPDNQGSDSSIQSMSGISQTSKPSFNRWESTNFGNTQTNEKFRRLMGIKSTDVIPSNEDGGPSAASGSASMFAKLEDTYERARLATHTQRGLGLGFSAVAATPLTEQTRGEPKQDGGR